MRKTPRYVEIDNILTSAIDVPELHRAAKKFQPTKDDVVLVTYPKCGTTWTLQIVSLILRKGEPLTTSKQYFSFIPFLERTTTAELSQMPKPRLIKTHLPFHSLNFSKEAKYIYVARHPADCVVSYYHHTRLFHTYFFTQGTFDDFFELFTKGEVAYNDYFDHLLDAYRRRKEPNVLFLTYESIKSNRRQVCLNIARFLGEEYYRSLLADDEAILKKVFEYSSLEFMRFTVNDFWEIQFCSVPSEEEQKSNPVKKNIARLLQEAEKMGEKSIGKFIRQGNVGEGKITLSAEQMKRLHDRIQEKTATSVVMSLWESI
ncbi:Sulfotransferase 1C4 [Araneus ventricosus]|uniref:Sulfotransferase 1C4 n=1 Tax=Araneus ventricosus TaxID=182803 RepID=A0A4Y2G1L9_ARAVE|nr:Sulfotransferase 1C4 [Araneus ventricosus]